MNTMGKIYRKDDVIWKKAFGNTLKMIMTLYSLDYHEFCDKYNVSYATFRYWLLGKKLPQLQYMEEIKEFLYKDKINDLNKLHQLHSYIAEFMCTQGTEDVFFILKRSLLVII